MGPQKTPPRAVLDIAPTQDEYEDACLIAAGRSGRLRYAVVWILAAVARFCAGLSMLVGEWSVLLGVLLIAAGVLLMVYVLVLEPGRIRRRARRDWETYRALMEPAQVQLYLDYAETHTPALVLTDSYALMEECIETPRLILLRKDEERLLILPRRCFAEQADGETALEFLRQTFARKRRVKRSWLF